MPRDQTRATFDDIPNNTARWWFKDPCLRKHIFYSAGCLLCPFYLGYDQSLLNGLQALPYWGEYFDKPSGATLGLISACIFLPGAVMGFPAAWVCNHYGRKWAVIVGSLFIIAGGVWNGLSTSRVDFMISRVIMGIGGAFAKTSAPALLQETAHPRLRGPLSTMYYGFYYTGSLLSAIMCIIGLSVHNDWSWRFPCILAIIGPVAVIAVLINAPESPRFLISKGREEKALDVLAKHHANGDKDDKLVQWELEEIRHALHEEELNNKTSYLDFLRTPGNRKRLWVSLFIGLGVNWVGNGIVSYYLAPALKAVGITHSKDLLSINVGLAAFNLIVAETVGLNAHRFGRRTLFLVSTSGMIVSYAFVMGFNAGFAETSKTALGIAAIPFLFLFYGSYDIAWTTLNYSYCAEIMPYNLRVKGLALYLAVQQAGNAFNQFVNPIALDSLHWRYYAVYIAIDCVYLIVIYFCFPETKSLSIEEVALVFDYGTKDGRKRAAAAFEDRVAAYDYGKANDGEEKVSSEHIEVGAVQKV